MFSETQTAEGNGMIEGMIESARNTEEAIERISSYDWILVNSSAGKDSQAMLDFVVELATFADVLDRVVVVHCDLGRVEWTGTRDLAEKQASLYGVRFEVVTRPQGDLLTHVENRGQWPSSAARYCTSDHKRGQVAKLMTQLAKETREKTSTKRAARILNCMGLRAAESPARSKKVEFENDARATNSRRHVDTWLPILTWSVDEVWARIRISGVPHHRAYDLGMPRLSCCFCIMSGRDALLLAGEHNPELLAEHVRIEKKIGHTFKSDLALAEIQDALASGERAGTIRTWEA